MKFKIILNEQTPKLEIIKSIESLIKEDCNLLIGFIKFARNQYNCAGLASNQCSIGTKKIQNRIMHPFFVMKRKGIWEIYIYPKINKYYGQKEQKKEGCLTWIGKHILAERYECIEVEYYDLSGNLIKEDLNGFEAQIFQHEYDHLNGKEEIIMC